MKIIRTDNYARVDRSDALIASGLNAYYAEKIVELLNEDNRRPDDAFFKAVPDEHKLYIFEPQAAKQLHRGLR